MTAAAVCNGLISPGRDHSLRPAAVPPRDVFPVVHTPYDYDERK